MGETLQNDPAKTIGEHFLPWIDAEPKRRAWLARWFLGHYWEHLLTKTHRSHSVSEYGKAHDWCEKKGGHFLQRLLKLSSGEQLDLLNEKASSFGMFIGTREDVASLLEWMLTSNPRLPKDLPPDAKEEERELAEILWHSPYRNEQAKDKVFHEQHGSHIIQKHFQGDERFLFQEFVKTLFTRQVYLKLLTTTEIERPEDRKEPDLDAATRRQCEADPERLANLFHLLLRDWPRALRQGAPFDPEQAFPLEKLEAMVKALQAQGSHAGDLRRIAHTTVHRPTLYEPMLLLADKKHGIWKLRNALVDYFKFRGRKITFQEFADDFVIVNEPSLRETDQSLTEALAVQEWNKAYPDRALDCTKPIRDYKPGKDSKSPSDKSDTSRPDKTRSLRKTIERFGLK